MSEPDQMMKMSLDGYLNFQETAVMKHEYVRGHIFAMAGATNAHNTICSNLNGLLYSFLRGRHCRVFQGAMARIEASDCVYLPDIMVTCESLDRKSPLTMAPRLIVEVLSRSTKQVDRREKLVAYQQLSSLKQFALVHQDRMKIESHAKIANDEWISTVVYANDNLTFDATPEKTLTVPVSAIYEKLDLPPFVSEPEEEYEPA